MASLKMHKLALHAGVSGSIVSTLKGGSQTSDLSPLCTLNHVRHRSASPGDAIAPLVFNGATLTEWYSRGGRADGSASPANLNGCNVHSTISDVRHTTVSTHQVTQNSCAPLSQQISSSCLCDDESG
jgi:hypothetical protein